MPLDIYENTKLTPSAILEHGVKAGEKVEFAFCQDGKEIKRQAVDIKEDAEAGATVTGEEYTAPAVADDKESYALDFHFYHGKDATMNCAQYVVWPKNASLTAVWNKDDSKFPSYRFRVMQGGKLAENGVQKTMEDGIVTFPLEKGKGFTIEAISPYLIEKWETEKGRKRKLKGDVKVEAEFVAPKAGAVKQYVNFDVEESGRTGVGNEVVVQVGVKGDRDKSSGDRVGQAGIFVHVKVTFGPAGDKKWNSKSERNDPKTVLKAGLNLSNLVEKVAGKEYTGKVEIAGPDNVGEFKVCLGNAGGDTCLIEIGGTDACEDAKLTFTNWRKLYYELMAPDFMDLEADNFPQNALTEIKNVGATVFIEYIHEKSHIFTEAECPAGTVYTGKFVGRDGGPFNRNKVYLLTDYSFTLYPKNFDGGKSPRLIQIKLCDVNYFFDAGTALTTIDGDVSTKQLKIPIGGGYFMPASSIDGTSSIKTFTWEADLDVAALDANTQVVYNAPVRTPSKPAKVRNITVKELNQKKEHKIEYKKPKIGHIPTEIPSGEKTKLETFLGSLFDDANKLRAHNEIKIEIHAEDSESDRQETRFKAVEDFVKDKLGTLKTTRGVVSHPALDNAGDARKGNLSLAEVNMDESTSSEIVVDLPEGTDDAPGPGKLAGVLSATQCPIKFSIEYESHNGGLGLAGRDAQEGENLVVFNKHFYSGCIHVMFHEMSHSLGLSVNGAGAGNTHAPGMPDTKFTTEDDPVYAHNGSKGHIYEEHGHSGWHCAYGMSDADKTTNAPDPDDPYQGGTCIMFGENTDTGPSLATSGFCPQCRVYIKARDLSAI